MAITTRRIIGPALLPDGTAPVSGKITCTLRGWDRETGAPVLPFSSVSDIVEGIVDVSLWACDLGERYDVPGPSPAALYDITITAPNAATGACQSATWRVAVTAGSGDLVFADLLAAGEVAEPTPPDLLAPCQAFAPIARTATERLHTYLRADYAAILRITGMVAGDTALAASTMHLYEWSGSAWGDLGGPPLSTLHDAIDGEETARIAADALNAPLASPALTGTPTAPTAAVGTSTTQIATTAFVGGAVGNEAAARVAADGAIRDDLTALTGRIAALEGRDLTARNAVLEAGSAAPEVLRYHTRAQAAAATVVAGVDLIEVQAYSESTPAAPALYARAASASVGSFQSADGAHWAPAWAETQLEMLGALGDGVTSDQAAWGSAKSLGKPILLSRAYLVTDDANPVGVPLIGSGRIIKAVTGGHVQKNSYSGRGPVRNRQHLWLAKQTANAGTPLKVAICGDSTATNSYGLNIANTVKSELEASGIPVASLVNSAISGTGWTSGATAVADILTAYGEQKHLLIIKYGINEAETAGDTAGICRDILAQLAAVRASTYGGYDDLSILLIMPNCLGNNALSATGRNNLWLESIREIYYNAADAYQCAIYNPYDEAGNAVGGEGRWLDRHLTHPQVSLNLDIWGRAIRETMATAGSYRRNGFVQRAFVDGVAPAASGSITQYPMGLSVMRAQSSDGWPFNGIVTTMRHPDTVGWQRLDGVTLSFAQGRMRDWMTEAAIWSAWPGASVALTLQNNWVRYNATLAAPHVRRTADGLVSLGGVAKNGVISAYSNVAILPNGYRPASAQYALGQCLTGSTVDTCILHVLPTGEIQTVRNVVADYLSLDGITFWAAS
ncbi:SGNH/GDSL hydrolase family protein [Rhodobacter lacus]|uniref:SGNH/GDSL hydrolase family protein n=1 Tax=Rhodobacter lacus TaxID=1641972 RepID=A0ABW5ADS4_9RHOB